MKRIFLILIAFLFVMSGFVSVACASVYKGVGTSSYSLEVPSDWLGQCQSADAHSSCTFYTWADDGNHGGWMEVNPENPGKEETLDQFVDDWISGQQRRHNPSPYNVYGRSNTSLGGLAAIEYEAQYVSGYTAEAMKQKIVFAKVDGANYYILNYDVRAAYYNKYLNVYDHAKKTFAFSGAPATQATSGQLPAETQQAKWYAHSQLGFKVLIPPNWSIAENYDGSALELRPPLGKGYDHIAAISTQSQVSLAEFVALWEKEFVKLGNVASQKLKGENMNINGMPAYHGLYRAEGFVGDVYWVNTPYVFYIISGAFKDGEEQDMAAFEMTASSFQAPLSLSPKSYQDFEAGIKGETPSRNIIKRMQGQLNRIEPGEQISKPAGPSQQPRSAQSSQQPVEARTPLAETKVGAQPTVVPPEDKRLGNLFQEASLGYSIRYPSGWVFSKPDSSTVLFSGKDGTKAYFSTVNIQNIASVDRGGKSKDVDAVIANFKSQFSSGDPQAKFLDEKSFAYNRDGLILSGKQFKVEYNVDKQKFRQWIIVLSRLDRGIFYSWMYLSPADQYEMFAWVAKAMLDNWTMIP